MLGFYFFLRTFITKFELIDLFPYMVSRFVLNIKAFGWQQTQLRVRLKYSVVNHTKWLHKRHHSRVLGKGNQMANTRSILCWICTKVRWQNISRLCVRAIFLTSQARKYLYSKSSLLSLLLTKISELALSFVTKFPRKCIPAVSAESVSIQLFISVLNFKCRSGTLKKVIIPVIIYDNKSLMNFHFLISFFFLT